MSQSKLVASPRTDFGKGAARRTRRAGRIPAVLYGHGTDPVHVSLPGHETFLALKHSSNPLFEIELDGGTQLALAKDVQRDPIRDEVIEHLDLLIVTRGEKVSVDVPVHVVGESAPGTIHVVETQAVTLEADATHIPEIIEVSVEGLAAGAQITAGELVLPTDAVLTLAPETVVVTVSEPRGSAEDEAADAEVAAEQSAASAAAADAADDES